MSGNGVESVRKKTRFLMKSIISILVLGFSLVQTFGQVVVGAATPSVVEPAAFLHESPSLTLGPANLNLVVSSVTLADLTNSLLALQTNLEQTLVAVTSFNDNFSLISLGANEFTAVNPAGNYSANFANNFGVNYGVNAAVSTGGSLFNVVANRMGRAAAAGLPQDFSTISMNRDSLRTLLNLQSDIERILSTVNFLNGGTYSGSLTNNAIVLNP